MGFKGTLAQQMAPRIGELAPGLTTTFVREALNRAIVGVGPLAPAALAAEKQLKEQRGDVDRAIHEVIENNVRLAGAQGFAMNLGGVVTAAVAIPANVAGLAIIECRMAAGIAHLRGHDLAEPRVRSAVMALLLGEDKVNELIKQRKLPGTPMELATTAHHDATLDGAIASIVANTFMARMTGKRLASTIGRRVPVISGVVRAGADGYETWRVGRYADRELMPTR